MIWEGGHRGDGPASSRAASNSTVKSGLFVEIQVGEDADPPRYVRIPVPGRQVYLRPWVVYSLSTECGNCRVSKTRSAGIRS